MDSKPSFAAHHVPHGQGRVYARDYKGAGPAFVLMHGFPDNLKLWDDLIPYLVASGRRVVAFDFLGFGASDKSAGATYSFQQQLGDLEAVVEALDLGRIVPVAHDASGFAAINFAIEHPHQVDSVCLLDSVYADPPTVQWPEMVELFAGEEPQCALGRYCAKSGAIRLVAQLAEAAFPGDSHGCPESALRRVPLPADRR